MLNGKKNNSLPIQTRQWLLKVVENAQKIVSVQELIGGMSSNMYSVVIQLNDQSMKEVVVREIRDLEWLDMEANIILQEKVALHITEQSQLPTPVFIAVDNGDWCPYPTLVMSKLTGEMDLKPNDLNGWLHQLAIQLKAIHEVKANKIDYRYEQYKNPKKLSPPSWSNHQDKWQKVIDYVIHQQPKQTTMGFIHRDYHPNNVLWTDGKITGIVDWINACMGPAGVDVGHCRWNIAMIHGLKAADDFLCYYLLERPVFEYDVYWDLVSLLDVLSDPLEVYEGWKLFGHSYMTKEVMTNRMDQYICHLLKKI